MAYDENTAVLGRRSCAVMMNVLIYQVVYLHEIGNDLPTVHDACKRMELCSSATTGEVKCISLVFMPPLPDILHSLHQSESMNRWWSLQQPKSGYLL